MALRLALVLVVLSLVACGGSSSDTDGGVDAGHMDGAAPDTGVADTGATDAPAGDTSCTTDADGDGHVSLACGGDDCNDMDAAAYPGHLEVCDAAGHDEDCNPATLGPDGDGDGFAAILCCNLQPSGPTMCGEDCDDTRLTVSPDAIESCNSVDDDCDGTIDDGVTMLTCFVDADGDTYASASATSHMACSCTSMETTRAPATSADQDCNDSNAGVHPTATDVCDLLDNDCDGTPDNGPGAAYYADCDVDNYGDPAVTHIGCSSPTIATPCAGGVWRTMPADCDDTRASVHPGATETCNGRDDECNGTVDDVAAPLLAGDAANCGACGHACHGWGTASATCASAICVHDVLQLAPTTMQNCALHAGGTVSCWGSNASGQLGDGTTTLRASPVSVTGLSDAVEVAGGQAHTCARRAAGTVVCWGRNNHGQLGDGTLIDRLTPVAMAGISDAVGIAAGATHTCLLRAGGSVLCVGEAASGQLGDGTLTSSTTLVAVTGLTGAVEISSRYRHTCARLASGAVRCWGLNTYGGLGDGMADHFTWSCASGDCSALPVTASGVTDAVGLSVGAYTTCVVRSGGSVSCWGDMLGLGGAPSRTPTAVPGLTDIAQVSTGFSHACARHSSGALSCWGSDTYGQLGNGGTTTSLTPVDVIGLTDATTLVAADVSSCALRANGTVVCWGSNMEGELGNGSLTESHMPTPVVPP